MEKRLPNVLKLLEGAKDGDEECLRLLKLQHGYDYDPPPVFDPAKCKDMDEMRDAVSELAYLVASFKKLGLDHCERKTRVALSYMLHVLEAQTGKKVKTVKNLDGEGIAEDCLGVVTDLCGTADLLVIINDMEERRLQKLKDNEGSEDSMEEEEQSDDKSDDDKGENEEEEGESEEEGSTDDDDIGEEAEDATSKSSSHHVNRKCLVKSGCAGYCGPNLRRHLVNVHANKNHIRHQDVDRFFAMGLHYKRKRGPSRVDKKGKAVKGRWKRWCPEPFCPYLGAYLPEHLQNKHRMKQCSAKYRTALKIARRYKGVKEEMDQMLPPEPPIVEVVAADQASLSPSDGSDNDGCIPLHSTSLPKAKTSKTVAVCVSDSENVIPPTPLKATGSGKPARKQRNSEEEEECDEDDENVYPMAADYFQEKNPKSNRHKWLVHFYKHLFTPNAGFHKDGNRLQHACQVRKLLEECDPHGNDITFLADDEGNKVWVDWVVPNLKKKKPGTLKSYMTSLEMFLAYVSKKGTRPHLPDLDVNVKNELFDMGNSLKKWRRCITKETSAQKWDRYLNESEQMLTADEVQEMMNSQPAVDGRKALQEAEVAESPDELTVTQYCDARDLIIFTLTRLVGTRPGALENATIDMFEKAKWDDQKRRKVMLVSSHKREEDGPAPIPLTAENEFQLKAFIYKLRPMVADDGGKNGKIFLKKDGAPFHRGTIGRRVTSFVVKSGIRPDKLVSATDFRKWIVTELKRKKRMGLPIDEDLLRRLMCHSDKTANEWYLRESLTEEAAAASALIEEHTKPSSSNSKSVYEVPCSTADCNSGQDAASTSSLFSSSEVSLTSEQISTIKSVFADDVSEGIEPRKKRVVALMKSNSVLRCIANSGPHIKKVLDRVRYFWKIRPSVNPEDLPQETASQRTAAYVHTVPERPPSTIESGRVEWDEEETVAIQEVLKDLDKCPSKAQIQQLFSRNTILSRILKENTAERVKNKVKNEFRKLKR